MTTIAEQSAALSASSAEYLPAEVRAAFDADLAALVGAGLPAGVASPGTPVPDGALLDAHGAPTSLAAARGGRSAVVVLYRGDWCPYCNLTLRTYQQELLPALTARDVALIAVSPQTPDGALSMQEKNELAFAVLSDPGNQIGAGLGVLTRASDDARAAQEKLGLVVADANADGTATLPMPTVAVVDPAGLIRWIDVHPDYDTRSEVTDILAAVSAL